MSSAASGRILAYLRGLKEASESKREVYSQLFKLENGKASQLTNYRNQLLMARISYDGSTIAVVGDISVPQKFDLFLYDVATSAVLPTNLIDRVKEDPAFALK